MPKATYMYWQKRFNRENPDKEIKKKILEIRDNHKDYGYRRMVGELRNQGYCINKKKVQRIMQKLGLQVTSFTRKSRKYSSYKGKIGTVAPNRIKRRFNTHIPHQKITTDTTEFKHYEVDTKGHMTLTSFTWIHLWICVAAKSLALELINIRLPKILWMH